MSRNNPYNPKTPEVRTEASLRAVISPETSRSYDEKKADVVAYPSGAGSQLEQLAWALRQWEPALERYNKKKLEEEKRAATARLTNLGLDETNLKRQFADLAAADPSLAGASPYYQAVYESARMQNLGMRYDLELQKKAEEEGWLNAETPEELSRLQQQFDTEWSSQNLPTERTEADEMALAESFGPLQLRAKNSMHTRYTGAHIEANTAKGDKNLDDFIGTFLQHRYTTTPELFDSPEGLQAMSLEMQQEIGKFTTNGMPPHRARKLLEQRLTDFSKGLIESGNYALGEKVIGLIDLAPPQDTPQAPSLFKPGAPLSAEVSDILSQAAEVTGMPSWLLEAVCKSESGGNADAVSKAGARGLMQVMPATQAELEKKYKVKGDTPLGNSILGSYYLKELWEKYGDIEHALMAYNGGPGNADRFLETGRWKTNGGVRPQENIEYASRVKANFPAGMSASAFLRKAEIQNYSLKHQVEMENLSYTRRQRQDAERDRDLLKYSKGQGWQNPDASKEEVEKTLGPITANEYTDILLNNKTLATQLSNNTWTPQSRNLYSDVLTKMLIGGEDIREDPDLMTELRALPAEQYKELLKMAADGPTLQKTKAILSSPWVVDDVQLIASAYKQGSGDDLSAVAATKLYKTAVAQDYLAFVRDNKREPTETEKRTIGERHCKVFMDTNNLTVQSYVKAGPFDPVMLNDYTKQHNTHLQQGGYTPKPGDVATMPLEQKQSIHRNAVSLKPHFSSFADIQAWEETLRSGAEHPVSALINREREAQGLAPLNAAAMAQQYAPVADYLGRAEKIRIYQQEIAGISKEIKRIYNTKEIKVGGLFDGNYVPDDDWYIKATQHLWTRQKQLEDQIEKLKEGYVTNE